MNQRITHQHLKSGVDRVETAVTGLATGRWPKLWLGTGIVAALLVLGSLSFGYFFAPGDVVQGDYARILFVHPATAMMMYLGFGIAAVASLAYLIPATRRTVWDSLAVAGVKVGLVFGALALATGALWGRPVWGTYWTWDARLTSTALLCLIFLGVLAVRTLAGSAHARATRTSVLVLLGALDIPIVHFSVKWWRTLHQPHSLSPEGVHIEGVQLAGLLGSFASFAALALWLVITQLRVEYKSQVRDRFAEDEALQERRAEQVYDVREQSLWVEAGSKQKSKQKGVRQ